MPLFNNRIYVSKTYTQDTHEYRICKLRESVQENYPYLKKLSVVDGKLSKADLLDLDLARWIFYLKFEGSTEFMI
jgi:hypothetical protein